MNAGSASNPFPGLRPFRTEEHHLFFGREEQTVELLGLLREHRFLAVVGSSGSGKSSLVRAGLIPALHRGAMAQTGSSWEVVVLRPGGNPIANLARALIEAGLDDASDAESQPRLQATLSRSLYGLVEAVRQSDARDRDSNLLVVVDQFEEVFRFRQQGIDSEEAAGAFVRLLLTASEQQEPRIFIAITMRSDYLGDCSQIPGLAEAVNRGEYLIPRLSRDQKREAIEKPIGVGGARIAPRLVQRMLNDVGDDPDQLPVLQHALMRTFDAWRRQSDAGRPIDLEHYEGIGGMEEALSRHADEVYAALPSDAHRRTCARIFQALTEKGADNRGIRRPKRVGELASIAAAGRAELTAVLDSFRVPGVTFLMPGSERELAERTVIDLSHESLMRVWTRLRHWVEEEAQSARVYRRLAETATLWRVGKAGLLRDPELQIARSWRDASQPNASWAEQYGGGFDAALAFLDESREAAEAEEQQRETARRRELEQANALADAQRRRAEEEQRAARRMRVLSAGAALVAIAAIIAFAFAVQARKDALQNAELATTSAARAEDKERAATELAAQLQKNLAQSDFNAGVDRIEAGDGSGGLSHLANALRTDPKFWQAGVRAMSTLASGRFPLRRAETIAQAKVITQYRFNDRQELLFTSDAASDDSGDDSAAERFVWDARTGERLWQVAPGKRLKGAEWSRDGRLLVASSPDDDTIHSWDARSGREASPPIRVGGLDAFRLGEHPRLGALVLTRSRDVTLRVWSASTGEAVTPPLEREAPPNWGFFFTPDRRRVYGLCSDGVIAIWEADGGARVAEISMRPHTARRDGSVLFTPDGEFVVCLADGGKHFNWWKVGDAPASGEWLQFEDQVDAWFLPGGKRVALIGTGEAPRPALLRAAVYDLATREQVADLSSTRPVGQVVYPESDPWTVLRFPILGAVEANVVHVWDLETGGLLRDLATPSLLAGAGLSPDGRRIFTVSSGYDVLLWDIFSGAPLLAEPIEHQVLGRIDFSPDGEKLVTYDAQEHLFQVWDSRTGRQLVEPIAIGSASGIYFTDGGSRLLLWESVRTTAGSSFNQQTTGKFHIHDLGLRPALAEPIVAGAGSAGAQALYALDGAAFVVSGQRQAGAPHQVTVWDAASRRLLRTLALPEGIWGYRDAFVLAPDGRRALLGASDGRARVWDLASGELKHDWPHPSETPAVMAAAISPDGARAATGTQDGKVRIWDLSSGAPLSEPLDHGEKTIRTLAFSRDGSLLASGSIDFGFRIADGRTGAPRIEPIVTENIVNSVDFSPDGAHAAVAPFAAEVLIIETASGSVLRRLPHIDACRKLGFSPDGALLAVGTGGNFHLPVGAAQLWNWREGRLVARALECKGAVDHLGFSPAGDLLATGTILNGGGAVQVWDVASGRSLSDPVAGAVPVSSVAFSPRSDEVLASWQDGSVKTIRLPPRDAADPERLPLLAEAVAGRRVAAGRGGIEQVPSEERDRVMAEIRGGGDAPGDAFTRWARWLIDGSPERTISPGSAMVFREYLARLRQSSRAGELQEALKFAPADGLTHARLALVLLDGLESQGELDRQKDVDLRLRRHWEETAAWHSRRAVELEPQNPEAWVLRAEALERVGRRSEAGAAVARAVELDPSRAGGESPNSFYMRAVALANERKWAEADAAFEKALDGIAAAAANPLREQKQVPLLGVLARIEPTRAPESFRELRLPDPIPGAFESFDAVPEGRVPDGWMAWHEETDAPRAPSASARLDDPESDVFEDWIAVSADRLSLSRNAPYWRGRTLRQRWLERINGAFPDSLLKGRFLYASSAERDSSGVQYLSTPDFDCRGRSGVHAVFHSVYEQAGTTMAALEYSIDEGQTWLPLVYRINDVHVAYDAAGKVDAAATLSNARTVAPLFIDAAGRPRGAAYGDFIGAKVGRELDPFVQGLRRNVPGDSNRVEVFPLLEADGRPKVRLRFLLAGRYGWYWGIDEFGLYALGGQGPAAAAPEIVDRTRDPQSLARLALAIALDVDPNDAAIEDVDALAAAFSSMASAPSPAANGGSGAPAAAEARSRRRRLDAALVARRAAALSPEDPAILDRLSAVLLWAGELDEADRATRKAFSRGAIPRRALSLSRVFHARGEALEQSGDLAAAGVAYELAHAVWKAGTGKPDRRILERLSAVGLVAGSEMLLPRGSEWRYLDDGSDPGPGWMGPDFDDAPWFSGKARLGYGNDGEVTRIGYGSDARRKNITAYFRAAFDAADASRFAQLKLSVQRDDGVVVYLNGREAARDNMPEGEITRRTLAPVTVNDDEEKRYYEFDAPAAALRSGRNVIAAEVHQQGETSSDLGFDLELEGVGGLKEVDWTASEIQAIEERLDIPPELRCVLWTARAERARRTGALERAAEALAIASRAASGNPGVAYERAFLFKARGEDEAAFRAYVEAVEGAIAMKTNAPSTFIAYLPEALALALEPMVRVDGLAIAAAARRLGRTTMVSPETEVLWLLRWSEALDADGHESRLERAEALLALGRHDQALAATEPAAALRPDSETPPREVRQRIEWLNLRERCLRRLGRREEADRVRGEIFEIRPRSPRLDAKLLDLSAHFNACLYDGRDWHGDVHLKSLPESFRPHRGVAFDLRGLIQLNSGVYAQSDGSFVRGKDFAGAYSRPYPDAVRGIRVGLPVKTLHLLGGLAFGRAKPGTLVARIVVHYDDDGAPAEMPLRFGEELVDWAVGTENTIDPARIAWVGGRAPRQLMLASWMNPSPERTVRELDFVSGKASAAPFLVGITVE